MYVQKKKEEIFKHFRGETEGTRCLHERTERRFLLRGVVEKTP